MIAPLGLVQEALPLLRQSGGLVVNISSDAAIGGYPGWGGYGASKAALDLVSLTLANELRDKGVGVVSVDPGDMRTQMHQDAFPGEDISDRFFCSPIGRPGSHDFSSLLSSLWVPPAQPAARAATTRPLVRGPPQFVSCNLSLCRTLLGLPPRR